MTSRQQSSAHELERLAAIGEVTGSAVHELRNALQVAATSVWLAKQPGSQAQAAAHLAKAERAIRTAQGVVDAVLGLARGERLIGESVAVTELLTDARADLEGSANWVDDVGEVRLRGSPVLLARVFHVLYENAIAIVGPNVKLLTKARTLGERVRIDVADDGPGIASGVGDVFQPLVSGREGGTGLGLSLARRIVAAHDGTLRVLGDGEERILAGAQFVIELPVAK